ncbi:MAG: hypothetical protein HN368_23575 [Spirochaetales bacterium]|jgi:hypothetical protein|nr:hypothetical protein [Spirochaetales bacterium]
MRFQVPAVQTVPQEENKTIKTKTCLVPLILILLILNLTGIFADNSRYQNLLSNRYGDAEREELLRIFVDAEEAGIGEDLLLPRVQEAQAKRVSSDKLISALRFEVLKLEEARSLLLQSDSGHFILANDAGWQRTANLLAWGARIPEIELLILSSDGEVERYLQGSYLFTSLVQWGLTGVSAGAISAAACESALPPDEYRGILEILIQSRRLRIESEEMAERLMRELIDSDNLRKLRRKVLK